MPLTTIYSEPDSMTNRIIDKQGANPTADKQWYIACGVIYKDHHWIESTNTGKRIWADEQTQQYLKAWSKWDIMGLLYSLKKLKERKW